RRRRGGPRRRPGAGLLPRPRHPLRALRAAVRARARAEQEAVGPPPQHRPALRRAADRDRRAPDDRGVGELDERAAGPDRDLRTGGLMSEKNPRPDRGIRTDDAERPGTGPAESGSWSSKPEVDGKRAAVPSLGLRGTLLFLW